MLEISRHMIDAAPSPVAPFSHVVRAGDFLFVTGQMPTAPGGGTTLVAGGIAEQTHQVMRNLQAVLHGVGARLEDTVMARVYLTAFERDYAAMNAVYESYFPPDVLPARTCIGVTGLAVGALVEIDLVAVRGGGP